jgi:cell division protease FtsH
VPDGSTARCWSIAPIRRAAGSLRNRIAVLLGGRAAEQALFDGDVSTGAADDLQRATAIALEMVTRYGMNAAVGQRTYAPAPQAFLPGAPSGGIQAADATAREIDVAVRAIITAGFDRAVDILKLRRADLDRGAEMLLTRSPMNHDKFRGTAIWM